MGSILRKLFALGLIQHLWCEQLDDLTTDIDQAAGRDRVGADLPQELAAEQILQVGQGGVVVVDDLVDVVDLEDLELRGHRRSLPTTGLRPGEATFLLWLDELVTQPPLVWSISPRVECFLDRPSRLRDEGIQMTREDHA